MSTWVRLGEFYMHDSRRYAPKLIGFLHSYCFGGALAIRLGSAGSLDSIVVCHPTHKSMDVIRKINIPVSWACAECQLLLCFCPICIARD